MPRLSPVGASVATRIVVARDRAEAFRTAEYWYAQATLASQPLAAAAFPLDADALAATGSPRRDFDPRRGR